MRLERFPCSQKGLKQIELGEGREPLCPEDSLPWGDARQSPRL